LLNKAQKLELREWRMKKGEQGGKKRGNNRGDRKVDNEKAIASAVEKKVTERLKAIEQENSKGVEAEAWVMSIMQKHADAGNKHPKVRISASTAQPAVPAPPTTPSAPSLKSIIKRATNAANVN